MILENSQKDLTSARIRNMALSQLLLNIDNNSLRYPFHERPSRRSYADFVDQLMSALNLNVSDDKDAIDDVCITINMQRSSWTSLGASRIYVCTHNLILN